jgi:hypothetical protein
MRLTTTSRYGTRLMPDENDFGSDFDLDNG